MSLKVIINFCCSIALENLFKYWFDTIYNLIPEIVGYLLKEVPCLNLYSYISLLGISRKEGLKHFDWEIIDKQKLKVALENCSDTLRSQAFSLVCTSKKTSVIPSEEEFVTVYQFLRQNVNSDNAAFRQTVLNSFTNFVVRIRDSIWTLKKVGQLEQNGCVKYCFSFLDCLNSFFLFNMNGRSNYQRKITSLELYAVVLTYLGEPLQGTIYDRKTNKKNVSLKTVLGDKFQWTFVFESEMYLRILLNYLFDEDSDIRNCSAKLLQKHFSKVDILKVEDFHRLCKEGLTLCSNQIFYKAESGAIITSVLLTLASNSAQECFRQIMFQEKSVFIEKLLLMAEQQFSDIREDLLRAAAKGSFLYGSLQAVRLVGFSQDIYPMPQTIKERLLLLIEEVVKYLVSVLSPKTHCDLSKLDYLVHTYRSSQVQLHSQIWTFTKSFHILLPLNNFILHCLLLHSSVLHVFNRIHPSYLWHKSRPPLSHLS